MFNRLVKLTILFKSGLNLVTDYCMASLSTVKVTNLIQLGLKFKQRVYSFKLGKDFVLLGKFIHLARYYTRSSIYRNKLHHL